MGVAVRRVEVRGSKVTAVVVSREVSLLSVLYCSVMFFLSVPLSLFLYCLTSFQCLYGCYVHSSIIPTFHRRCYWLLQVRTPLLLLYSSPHFSFTLKLSQPIHKNLNELHDISFHLSEAFSFDSRQADINLSPRHLPLSLLFSLPSLNFPYLSQSFSFLMALPIHAVQHEDGISVC